MNWSSRVGSRPQTFADEPIAIGVHHVEPCSKKYVKRKATSETGGGPIERGIRPCILMLFPSGLVLMLLLGGGDTHLDDGAPDPPASLQGIHKNEDVLAFGVLGDGFAVEYELQFND